MKIRKSHLMRARASVRRKAGREFPQLKAHDKDSPSLAAALKALDIDAGDCTAFCVGLVKRNEKRLDSVYNLDAQQIQVVGSALAHGIAIGVEAETIRRASRRY